MINLPILYLSPLSNMVFFLFCIWNSYETGNGIKGQETGTLKKATSPDTSDVIVSQGSVSYTAPDGTVITLTYAADDVNGFQPQVTKTHWNNSIKKKSEKQTQYNLNKETKLKRKLWKKIREMNEEKNKQFIVNV